MNQILTSSRLLPWYFLAATLLAIGSMWSGLARPQPMPQGPLTAADKLDCLSYTPFQPGQSPFDIGLIVSPDAIANDLARLAPLTNCIRTYSAASQGIEAVASAAARQGLKMLQGAWISRDPIDNAAEISAALETARRYPDTVEALVIGNEVLLRREQTAADLVALIRDVKSRTRTPVTYADVWEFWLKNPRVADAVDFLTIHILPYWEDDPVSASDAGRHVIEITNRVQDAFPGKKIIIGEVGWPSAGRMRAAALPSPVNQALVFADVIAATRKAGIRTNVIEAFDQPWKRQLEGTVGGHWGLLDAHSRSAKFLPGIAVTNYRHAVAQASASAVLAILAYFLAIRAAQTVATAISPWRWALAGLNIAAGSMLFGLAASPLIESAFGVVGSMRSVSLALLVALAPLQSIAIVTGTSPASFASLLGAHQPPASKLSFTSGLYVMFAAVIAMTTSLTLTFDPRYAELPFAVMTAAAVAVLCLRYAALTNGAQPADSGPWPAERSAAYLIVVTGLIFAIREGAHNWQALWLAAALVAFAVAMVWGRPLADPLTPDARAPKRKAL
jgi:exo-beta-1,3-glucanase (GH17 family)